jgi:hypothetical protein
VAGDPLPTLEAKLAGRPEPATARPRVFRQQGVAPLRYATFFAFAKTPARVQHATPPSSWVEHRERRAADLRDSEGVAPLRRPRAHRLGRRRRGRLHFTRRAAAPRAPPRAPHPLRRQAVDQAAAHQVETVPIDRLFCSPTNPRRNDAAVPGAVGWWAHFRTPPESPPPESRLGRTLTCRGRPLFQRPVGLGGQLEPRHQPAEWVRRRMRLSNELDLDTISRRPCVLQARVPVFLKLGGGRNGDYHPSVLTGDDPCDLTVLQPRTF